MVLFFVLFIWFDLSSRTENLVEFLGFWVVYTVLGTDCAHTTRQPAREPIGTKQNPTNHKAHNYYLSVLFLPITMPTKYSVIAHKDIRSFLVGLILALAIRPFMATAVNAVPTKANCSTHVRSLPNYSILRTLCCRYYGVSCPCQ